MHPLLRLLKLQVTMGISLGQARHFTFQNPVTKEEHSVVQEGLRKLAGLLPGGSPCPNLQTNSVAIVRTVLAAL